jgi:hypothetical protein
MKRPYLTISVFLLFITWQCFVNTEVTGAETTPVDDKSTDVSLPDKHPVIFFENSDFNFGQINKGEKVEHIYRFENRGNDILEIKKVKTSCGCTAAILTNKTIPPGKTGEIKAKFNSDSTDSNRGNIKKSISVLSNDPGTPNYKLTISGEIIEYISIKPVNINFGSISVDKEAGRTVTVAIKSQSEPDFKINKVTPSQPFIDASIVEEKDGEYILNVSLKDYRKIGRFSGKINLVTNSSKQQKAIIPFLGEITGDVTAYPKRIYYGIVTEGKELTQKVFVKINKEGIKVLDTKLTPDFLSVKIDEKYGQNNPHCLIEITLPKDVAIGKLNGLLELHTNSKQQPVIKIPITGEVKKG